MEADVISNDQYQDDMADLAEHSLEKLQKRVYRQQKMEAKKKIKQFSEVLKIQGKTKI